MALAGACVGGWLGDRLSERRTVALRPAAVLAAAAIFALTGYGLWSTGESGVRGTVALTPAGADGAGRSSLGRRRRALVHRDLVAGRRPRRRPARAHRTRRLPHDRADPGGRRVEDDDPPAHRQRAQRAADLPARRSGDPGRRRSRPRRRSSGRSGPSSNCSSASARPTSPAGCGSPRTASCWRSRSASWRCSPGACTASRPSRSRRAESASLRSADVSQHFVPRDFRALGVGRVEPLAGLAERGIVVPRRPVLA